MVLRGSMPSSAIWSASSRSVPEPEISWLS
jgi:hypothetical protein